MEELVQAEIAEDIAETAAIAAMRAETEAEIAELKRQAGED
jgi:GAF domain-containing protein